MVVGFSRLAYLISLTNKRFPPEIIHLLYAPKLYCFFSSSANFVKFTSIGII